MQTPPRPQATIGRIATKWGVILALAVALWTLAVHLFGVYTDRIRFATLVDTLALVLPVTFLWLALREAEAAGRGPLSMGRGIAVGTATAAVSAPLTVLALWYYHHYINPDWVSYLASFEGQKLASAGGTPEQVGARIAQVRLGGTDQRQIIGGLIGTLAMGLVVSTVLTFVLRWRARGAAARARS